ncbi:eCIS core domain-containing protein [Massilia violaceinigra]|nr:DUF4157 domain-containing protein [Massilia violaceinigra]
MAVFARSHAARQQDATAAKVPSPAKAGALVDQRPAAVAQRQFADLISQSPRMAAQLAQQAMIRGGTAQRLEKAASPRGETGPTGFVQRAAQPAPNRTGLPDQLKAGIETLSGMRMDGVRVHYNSGKAAQLNAHAYAQGTDIHIGPGQERHLPHEAWHVVQQAQGRVKPTMQMHGGVLVNDDKAHEHEADVMGAKAAQLQSTGADAGPRNVQSGTAITAATGAVAQRFSDDESDEEDEEPSNRSNKDESSDEQSMDVEPHGELSEDESVEEPTYGESSDEQSMEDQSNDESLAAETYTVRSDQKARRVYTTVGKTKRRRTGALADISKEGDNDYSYAQMSKALHAALERHDGKQDAIDGAVRSGTEIPLRDGQVPLDPGLDQDLQLIPFHMSMFQNFHTPPNLVSKKRLNENAWRQKELDNTKKWMALPKGAGLTRMLPQLPEGADSMKRLRHIYPGPIDIGFPPNEKKTLFTYPQNKAIFLLNKKMLLDAHLAEQEEEKRTAGAKRGTKRTRSGRRILTDSFMKTIAEQEGSTATDTDRYLRKALRMKRSDGDESLDEASSSDSEDDTGLIHSEQDSLSTRERKRKTFLNTLGLEIKILNRKILMDLERLHEAKENDDARERKAARHALRKHERLLGMLEGRHGLLRKHLHGPFRKTAKDFDTFNKKKKLVASVEPKRERAKTRVRRYDEALQDFEESPHGKAMPLDGLGKKKFENLVTNKNLPTGKKQKTVEGLAQHYGGSLQYGDSDGNNCLIFAIANAVGRKITRAQAALIRDSLVQANLAGVDSEGYLPATTRVVDIITQHVLGELYPDGGAPAVTVHIDTVLPGIAPVVVGNGGADVYVIHNGNHYWWVKRG